VLQPDGALDFAAAAAADQGAALALAAPATVHVRPPAPAPRSAGLSPGPQPLAGAGDAAAAGPAPGGSLGPSLGSGFLALPDNGTTIPPDTHGAVGPNHLVTMLNSQVRIHTRAGATVSTVALDTFWGGAGHFDPKVVYDALSGRFFATCDRNGRSASSQIRLAVSATSDPTGTWTTYTLNTDPAGAWWADFPGIGISSDKVVVTNNLFAVPPASGYLGVWMVVLRKSDMLAGAAVAYDSYAPQATPMNPTWDDVGIGGAFTMKPCLNYDNVAPVYVVDNFWYFAFPQPGIRVSTVTGTVPGTSWAVLPKNAPSFGLFGVPNNWEFSQIGASQLGTAVRIDTNDPRFSEEPKFRNGAIWCSHSGGLPVGAADRTAVFWYQLDAVTPGPNVMQAGVIQGGVDTHYYFPSIAANANDDALVGFTYSDPTLYASCAYTGRFAGQPAGTMDPPAIHHAGLDPYNKDYLSGRNRWGDYSATVVDPVNDLDFWSIQEFADANGGLSGTDTGLWSTWWNRFVPALPPVLTCPGNQVVPCNDGNGGWVGSVSGFSIDDPADLFPFTFSVSIDAGAPANWVHPVEGAFSVAFTPFTVPPLGPLPLGVHTIDFTATNTAGASSSCSFTITVQDTTPPTATSSLTRTVLWPARNGLMPVGFSYGATDGCDSMPSFTVSVYSNEANGAAPYTPDALVMGSTLLLRAERSFPGAGRFYVTRLNATDGSGNTGHSCRSTIVPLYAITSHILALQAQAAAAEAACQASPVDVAPPGAPNTIVSAAALP
jgi:hypothetical protein